VKKPFLTADWRLLAMFNFRVAPEVLRPYQPSGTVLDSFEGETWMSLVGFRFQRSRVIGVPLLGHQDFPEINLRFYVRSASGDHRGVVFIREIVPRPLIAFAARALFNEPYVTRHMACESGADPGSNPGRIQYSWRHRNRRNEIGVTARGTAVPIADGSHEEFIAMQHWGFTKQRDGQTIEYAVEHQRWSAWGVSDVTFDMDARAEYGDVLAAAMRKLPDSVLLLDGSSVHVGFPRRLAGS
jgi:uncharacterized protein YqjF (DUF2071 family)